VSFETDRLTTRLSLKPEVIEEVFSIISEIDAVKNSWKIAGKLLPQTIERLTHSVIVTSTGASNRIEGNKLTDIQVEELYRNLRIRKFKTRDEQEVAGYLEMLELVFDSYTDIPLKESTVLQLHRDMLKYSNKDERHRGQYKFGPNRVEAKDQSGKVVGIIFDPTPPHLTPKEMQELMAWYEEAKTRKFKHPLLLIANFVFEYLAIHPFQDGNGRTSRLLTNLMLLQSGYEFVSVVSHERVIEARKADYYIALNKAQSSWKSKKEDVSVWILYFLNILREQARQALKILEGDDIDYLLSEKQLALWHFVNQQSEKTFSRKEAIEGLGFPPRTVESCIKKLLDLRKISKLGEGRATRYRLDNSK
jgi:Fic family protein